MIHYSLRRATLWNIAGYIYLLIASFIATPILLKYLGIGYFSQYGLIIATLSLVSAINLGLPQAVTRELARNHVFSRSRQSLWATSSVLFVMTGLVAALLATVILYYLHIPYTWLAFIASIVLLNNLVAHYSTLPQAEGHFGYYNAKTFIVGTGNTLLAAYIAYKGYGIQGILIGHVATYFLTLLVLAYFSLKYFPRPRDGVASTTYAKSLAIFGMKNQVGTLIGQVEGQYSKYLLATIAPLSLSAFFIAQGLVYKIAGGIAQIASALYPASARGNAGVGIAPLYHRLQLCVFGAGLFGVALYHYFGVSFLMWWLQSSELVGLVDQVMQVFVWYLAVLSLTPLSSTILDSHGRPELTSLYAFATTFIEITVAIALYSHFGLMAPVYAALIASILTTPLLLSSTERVLNVK